MKIKIIIYLIYMDNRDYIFFILIYQKIIIVNYYNNYFIIWKSILII